MKSEERQMMTELTAEMVREIVKGEIGQLRSEMMDGFERVLNTMQLFHDDHEDEFVGVKGRLRNHNERIAKLERLNHLR